ncbi:hypothetical protein DNTS_033866 [Danionella cerebrum]|uniref:Glial cell line-derived neurotrophic factor n=1 Tax=Danionella cerebrum TaxID=2873325 RepID=A0A553NGJ5_9TELE|nr:hypothetical protein DNTS_033866 [Danionella translucida]
MCVWITPTVLKHCPLESTPLPLSRADIQQRSPGFSTCTLRVCGRMRRVSTDTGNYCSSLTGTESKMKLWDILAPCLLLLSSVSARPIFHKSQTSKKSLIRSETSLDALPDSSGLKQVSMEEQYEDDGLYPDQLEEVMHLIQATLGRLRRSSDADVDTQSKEEKGRQRAPTPPERPGRGRQRDKTPSERVGRGRADRKRGRGRGRVQVEGRGCLLKEIHLNVSDLGLGYRTSEELIFRYCSGPCIDAENNYDKILLNLSVSRKLDKDSPARTCCRPVAFDDDISFLDDSLEYHTLKKHSAKKCACV